MTGVLHWGMQSGLESGDQIVRSTREYCTSYRTRGMQDDEDVFRDLRSDFTFVRFVRINYEYGTVTNARAPYGRCGMRSAHCHAAPLPVIAHFTIHVVAIKSFKFPFCAIRSVFADMA